MSNKLTYYQYKVYDFIRTYISSNKCGPLQHEIQEACNIRSHKCVIDRLTALERKGYIKRKISRHRGIKLVILRKSLKTEGV